MWSKEGKSRLHEYALKQLGLRPYRRGWLKGRCPSCGREDKFGLNLGMNRTNCFVCGYHPIPIDLVIDVQGLEDSKEAWKFLKTFEGIDYYEPPVEKIERINVELPRSYRNLLIGTSKVAKLARRYLKRRGFDVEDLALKGWGYCTEGDYDGYIIMPFYFQGELVYFNGRKFIPLIYGPKYNNPKIEDFGIGKSLIMYNMDSLFIYESIYLLEGVINAETLGDQGIATGGKKVSEYQLSFIIKSPVKEIIILLDPDAMEDSYKVGLHLVNHKKVKVIRLPEDNDVNDLGKEKTLEIVEKSEWETYRGLIQKLNNIKREKRAKPTYN